MNLIMTAAAVCFFCLNGAMTRLFQLKMRRERLSLYQAGFCFIAAMLNVVFYGVSALPDARTVIMSAAFGLLFALASFLGALCYERGPMSLTSVILNMSLAVPVLYSFAFFGEGISNPGIIGLVLLCATFILSAMSTSNGGKINAVWLVMVGVAFAANGSTAVLQKLNQMNSGGQSDGFFLAFAYFISAICFLCVFVWGKKRSGHAEEGHCSGAEPKGNNLSYILKALLITAVSGCGSFVGNAMLNILSVRMDAAVLYPCVNGGLAVLTAVVSMVFFKEKPTWLKVASIAVGAAAIVLLAI